MSRKFTSEDLYQEFLEIKRKEPNHNFDNMDYIGRERLFKELEEAGKVISRNDIIGSFEIVD